MKPRTMWQELRWPILALMLSGNLTGLVIGIRVGKYLAKKECLDLDERRQFALEIADAAFTSAEVSEIITRVALARCRDKFPSKPLELR